MKITLTHQESESIFFDALCNAVGTGYMEGYGLSVKYLDEHYDEAKGKLSRPCYEDVLMQILRDGNSIMFIDHECDGEYDAVITLDMVHNRSNDADADTLLAMMNGEGDADTASNLLQYIAYNEVIFG